MNKKLKPGDTYAPILTKLSRIMRLMILMFILGINSLLAASGYSQSTKISLKMADTRVEDVLNQIESKSEFFFLFNQKQIDVNRKVSIEAKDEKISDILDDLFAGTDVKHQVIDRQIVLTTTSVTENQQQGKKVTGKVSDSSGASLPGVSVVVKGTTTGVITDNSGNYALSNIPDNATLQFSFVGMKMQELFVGSKTTINVTLAEDAIGLEEVIAIGYGTQKKGNLTGSIGSVKSEELTLAPVASTSNALAGRLPGLVSLQSSGQPGSDAAALSIRGFGSALVIVDGIESNFNNIDPNQIESISILKDGSASIYGSRAGNGVILITSKRGKDQKPIITLNSSYTLQGITYMPKPASAGQYAEMEREKWLQAGKPIASAPFTEEQIKKYYDGTDPQYPNTNWYKETVRDWAPQQQHNLSVRGGSDKIKYYGFFGYLDQQTMWKTNGGDYSRYNIQSNIDAKITDDLSIQLDLSSIVEDRKFPWRPQSSGANTVWQDFWNTLPIYPAQLPDPTKLSFANGSGTGGVHIITNSEIAGYNNTANQNLKGTFILNYNIKPIKGLSAKAFINYVQDYSKGKNFTKPIEFYTYDIASKKYTLAGALGSQAQLALSRSENRIVTGQLSLNYDNTFGTDHHLTALGLYEVIDYKNEWLTTGRDNYLTTRIEELFAGSVETMKNNGASSEMGRASYVGRVNYSFKNKYLIETTLRADASAKFPSDSRWGYFPGVSLGWRLNEESFMKNITALDELKVRASYGSSGNDAVGNFQYLSGYRFSGQWLIGSTTQKGLESTGLSNPDLTWEKIKIYNLGSNFSFWKRRLFGEADVFYRERSGLIATRILTLPNTFGASLPPENLNSINDRGFELVLGTSGTTRQFKYEISGNISWSRAKWDHYEEPVYSDTDQSRIYKKSSAWTDIQYGYLSDGLFTSLDEIKNLKFNQDNKGNVSLKPGDIKYVDTNNDGILDWKDQVKIGKGTTPHWMVGGTVNLKYKNFDLSTLFQGAFGYYSYISLDHGTLLVPEEIYKLRWTEKTNSANALIPRLGGSTTNSYVSDYWYKKADYLRLKMLSIGYNVPKNIITRYNLQELRFYFSATNLFTISKLKNYGVDPEAQSGQAAYYYPQQKTITFGVNLSF